ncbi:MAG: aldehyde dehydrogenase [Candidatus Methanoperedens sp.]|nr:aldehyde dehydrogenase [Candidatus Methanoperedens sp.]
MIEKYKMFIGGKWVDSISGEFFDVINPATEENIALVPLGTKEDAKAAIDAAREAFDSGIWSNKTPAERSQMLWKLADLVEANVEKLARLESMNTGKTIKYSKDSDLPFIIDNLRFFAGAARMLDGRAASNYNGLGMSMITREPIGVVAGVVPWNYPLYIAIWKLAPALAAGNTIILKPASYTPLTLLEFAKLADRAGMPKGVLNVITGPGDKIGKELATSPGVDMISLTGDTSTGKKIMQMASGNLKKVHLELGGKAPFIVMGDADIDAATEGAVAGAFLNSGQDCTAATRIYLHESIHDAFIDLLVKKTNKIKIGDPFGEKIDMGPLISGRQRERIESYVKSGIEGGANLVYGGKRPENLKKGYFFEPTIFTNVEQKMKICQGVHRVRHPTLTSTGARQMARPAPATRRRSTFRPLQTPPARRRRCRSRRARAP